MKLDPFPTPTFDTAPVLHLIEQLGPFRQARAKNKYGQPQIPHSYVVRGRPPENEALYVALFQAIQQHGRQERFGRFKRQYLYPGDGQKYWTMSPDLDGSTIINRMLIVDDLERMRASGQIPRATRT